MVAEPISKVKGVSLPQTEVWASIGEPAAPGSSLVVKSDDHLAIPRAACNSSLENSLIR
jgi:hypothetical protein